MTNPNEIWQVEVNNQIFTANVEELCQWITEGALLPEDHVRRGNLRWLEANKVPLLNQFFNAKERGLPFPILQSAADASQAQNDPHIKTENYAASQIANQAETASETPKIVGAKPSFNLTPADHYSPNACVSHAQTGAQYVCEGCSNLFCKLCPKSYGSSVKICPLCGAMCRLIADVQAVKHRNAQYQNAISEGFGFADFGNALAYPFKFKTSLIAGAVMFMFFTLGQSASALGGTFVFAASIFCVMLANTLTFGCLSNTLENFSNGKIDQDFMPRFDDFTLWDDILHPFFLSVATYLISFGLLAALLVGAFYYAMKTFDQIETEREKMVSAVFPNAQNELNSAKQIPQINQVQKQLNEQNKWKNGGIPDEKAIADSQRNASRDDAEFQKLEEIIRQNRQSQLESIAGKNPEATARNDFSQLAANMLRLSLIFAIPIFLAFLWGVFYFPAACAVAGYTRSFTAVLNPLIGLDTIRRLGFNYAKILAMCFALGVFSMTVSFVLATIFSPFDLPRMGNLPVTLIGSLFTFYFSIVFSVTLGFALYKNSARLNLNRA